MGLKPSRISNRPGSPPNYFFGKLTVYIVKSPANASVYRPHEPMRRSRRHARGRRRLRLMMCAVAAIMPFAETSRFLIAPCNRRQVRIVVGEVECAPVWAEH